MEEVLAFLVTVVPLTVGSIWFLGKTALGRAVARRIEGGSRTSGEDVDALHEEVQHLREQNIEILERLDFAERLLTRARNATPPAERIVSGES